MKETGIIMSGHHPVDILEGRKTKTRRTYGLSIINDPPQKDAGWQLVSVFQDRFARFSTPSGGDITLQCPYGGYGDRLWCKQKHYLLDEYLLGKSDILYRLTDDRICAILTMEVQDERYKTDEWCPSQAYPSLPQRGLHGRVGWSNLLTNKIQRLWAEGIRGLVSAERTQQWQGISSNLNVSQQPQSNQECSPPDMYGFSWDATIPIISDQTFRRKWSEQLAEQFALGHSGGELVGQEGSRTRKRRGEAPDGEANKLPDEGSQVGNRDRVSQPAPRCEDTWDVAGWHLRSCPPKVLKLVPSIFMPRWASRILLEITEIRVERLQEITPENCLREGLSLNYQPVSELPKRYAELWDSLNGKKHPWVSNPWVWVISFKRLEL